MGYEQLELKSTNYGRGFGTYEHSFGALGNNTRYYAGGLGDFGAETKSIYDMRPALKNTMEVGMKALLSTSGGAGTAGYALVPVYVDPRIVDQSRKFTPLTEILPRVTNMGKTADYNVILSKGGAYVAGENAALPDATNVYDRLSQDIKYLYSVGLVTGQSMAAMPSYMLAGFQPAGTVTGGYTDMSAENAKQMEVLVAARALKELEENLLINGDVSTDANQFNGFVQQISTTNKTDKNTTALSLEDINTAIKDAFDDGGRPNLGVCSSGVYTDLMNLLTAKIGYLQPTQTVFWGFSTIVLHTMVGQIPVIPSMYMSNTSGSKSLYFLDLSVIEVRVLLDMTYEELAKTNDGSKFMLKEYLCLVVKAPAFCSWIGEIA